MRKEGALVKNVRVRAFVALIAAGWSEVTFTE